LEFPDRLLEHQFLLTGKPEPDVSHGEIGVQLQPLQKMREVGKKATGRPRLPDDQVKPNSLYQRARREGLRAEAKSKKEK
jgi:hypothetical protein